MIRQQRDPALDALLDLDGEITVVDDGPYWTKFVVKRVPASQARPHGLHYSLTLHNEQGDRLLGFDNAHPVQEGSEPSARMIAKHDHRHHLQGVRLYEYKDAGLLLTDFWEAVMAFLKQQGG